MTGRRIHILCIDDDQQTLEIRKLLLEIQGFKVSTASSGPEGLQAFRAQPVDAVVCDYNMPEMDGGEVATRLKQIDARVPVMILSALPFLPVEAPPCIDAFVTKGESTATLVRRIEQMIEAGARKAPQSAPPAWRQVPGVSAKPEQHPRRRFWQIPSSAGEV